MVRRLSTLVITPVFILCCGTALFAGEPGPVGVWSFDGRNETLVQDRSPFATHGIVRGTTERGPGPWGRAMSFDGERTYVMMPGRVHLRMTDALTVDVWLKLPKSALGKQQCVVDKGGERYRIHISSSGGVMFGLKGAGGRADLGGGKLKPDTWHRITGVFDRPKMELYLDCEKVAERTWDHEIGGGGNLIFGSKSGVADFFEGWIAHVCVYSVPRPPPADDVERFKRETITKTEKKLQVTEDADGLTVDTGVAQFAFASKGHGGIQWAKVGDKYLARNNTTPPLFASLLESETYDGLTDFVPDVRHVAASYKLLSFEHKQDDEAIEVTTESELSWPAGDRVTVGLTWTTEAGSPHVAVTAKLARHGDFTKRFIREIGLQLPLTLNFRKRIIQGGDQGWQFDTRHYYQFHVDTRGHLMTEPEHNWWRYFMVEQDSPTHFRAWRSESADTASLTAQHGHQAPGWIAAYDQQGGALWAYHDMHHRPAKAVAMDAADSGVARIYLHPPTVPALGAPEAERSIFHGEHRMDWVWFAGDPMFVQPTRTLADAWGQQTLASDPPAWPRLVDIDLWDAEAATDERVPMITGGLPLPKSAIDHPDQVRLFDGRSEVPLQTRALAYWPDRSIKWLLLVFPLDGHDGLACLPGTGEGESVEFDVTLRQDGHKRFRLAYGKQVHKGNVESMLTAKHQDGTIEIDTGQLAFAITAGERWLSSIRLNGRELLRQPSSQPLAFVDFLRSKDYAVNTTHPQGTPDPGVFRADKIELEENGPLRAVVRIEGMTTSQEPQRMILRLEAYAGRSYVKMLHSVEFLHKDPRDTFVQSMGLCLPLDVDAKVSRVAVGTEDGPRDLSGARFHRARHVGNVPHGRTATAPDSSNLGRAVKTGLRQSSHVSYSVWQQTDREGFPADVEHGQRCRGWLSLVGETGGCTVVVRNMWQEHPKEIVADPESGEVRVGLWPDSAPLMDVRRYSNYPHPSQGESARHASSWVDKSYYPNDPFVGVSKTNELLLYFHDAGVSTEQIDAVAADFQSPGLVYVSPEWYASLGIALSFPAPDSDRFPRLDANLERVTDFWLFHQKIWAWYGMWDYGDVMHKFGPGGYGRILPPDEIARLLKLPAEERHSVNVTGKGTGDYRAQQDWCFDNGRWGWGNTEGLPGLFLQIQYLRTGRRDIYRAVEAMARHTRDVDMRHDGMWFGKGTRHGVQHWSDGNHEERQTTHTEWRFYSYLSGDLRCRDFSKQLTERHYTATPIRIHAAHSGRLYGLLTRWEMTGDPKLGEMLERYVHCFTTPEGIDISPSVKFPEATRVGEPREVNGESMFFHAFAAMHALLEYYELTRDPELKDALIRMADYYGAQTHRNYTFRKVVNFAAMHADDPAPYRRALDEWLDSSENYHLFHLTTDTPKHWTGPTALLRPGVSGLWFWLGDAHYLMAALDREPQPTEAQTAAFAEMNKHGSPQGFSRESWQSEYDRPDLAEYLRDRRRE
ncbi:MAG: LamG domain-containing protein [Pirellulaceae bacterium]|nr:LamG domain-containing protein [Pirellulaceae bacterium]